MQQSIFEQIEFIFLDCGSPENERKIIRQYTKAFNNIKYYKLGKDPGLYAGWNIAIKKCTAPIIGNWNIDDRKNSEGIEIMLKQFERNADIDVVYGPTYISKKLNERYMDNDFSQVYPCLPHSLENLFRNNSPHCMPLWKKSLHDKYGFFDEKYKTAADGDFWLRCAIGGAIMKMVNHPVGLYFENPEGRSTNPETLKEMVEEVQNMRKFHLERIK
jgi:glycosyltransferase involved in cell wall biosynthesis